jgi:predicted unusual protein kinase regulating ubiquinone biosynthesis (AarF/ABC1/UbiB family)
MMRAGGIGLKFLAKVMMSASSTSQPADLKLAINRLRLLRDTLQEYGGVFAKVSQMLSLDTPSAEVFDECHSRLTGPTHDDFLTQISELDFFVRPEVVKSGSLSHLYLGNLRTGEKVAVKVQYVGLADRCQEDLYSIKLLATLLYNFPDMASVMDEVTSKIKDELNYELEAESQAWFASISRVRIPRVYPEHSTRTRLVTEFVEGEDFGTFTLHATPARKAKIAGDLCRFLFGALWGHGALYSDVHFGNLLVDADDRLVVLDFGCVHRIEPELKHTLERIWDDPSANTLREVGILPDTLTAEEIKYAEYYFAMHLEPWKTEGFVFNSDYTARTTDRDQSLTGAWNMPRGVIYINKIVYSLYNVLASLKAPGIYWPTIKHVLADCANL